MSRRLALLALALTLTLMASACSSSESSGDLRVDGRIGETRLEDASASDPFVLDPNATTVMALSLVNESDEDLTVEHVRVEGELLGLTFLTYDVRVLLEIPAGETRFVEIPLDFFDLDAQAHGFLRTHIRTYDTDRQRLSSDEFAVDVRGKVFSTMVIFALVLMAITAGSLWYSLRDLARRTLPEHRFARGMRFLIPGLGIGLLLSSAFSILRIFPLPASSWVPLTVIPAAVGFAAGYFLTPAPEIDESEELAALEDELSV